MVIGRASYRTLLSCLPPLQILTTGNHNLSEMHDSLGMSSTENNWQSFSECMLLQGCIKFNWDLLLCCLCCSVFCVYQPQHQALVSRLIKERNSNTRVAMTFNWDQIYVETKGLIRHNLRSWSFFFSVVILDIPALISFTNYIMDQHHRKFWIHFLRANSKKILIIDLATVSQSKLIFFFLFLALISASWGRYRLKSCRISALEMLCYYCTIVSCP